MEKNKKTKTTTKTEAAPKLLVQKIYEDAKLPVKPKTTTDAGYDVFVHNIKYVYTSDKIAGQKLKDHIHDEKLMLAHGQRALIGTGIKATVGEGWEIQVRSRSGKVLKHGLVVLNSPGTVDAEYRGELGIILCNTGQAHQYVEFGEAVAQIVPKRVEHLEVEEVKELPKVEKRGTDGFGSTDKRPVSRQNPNQDPKFAPPPHLDNLYATPKHLYIDVLE